MHFQEKLKSDNPFIRLEGRIERFKSKNSALTSNDKYFSQVAPGLYEAEFALKFVEHSRPMKSLMEGIKDTPILEWWREYMLLKMRSEDVITSTDKEPVNR